MTTVIAIVGRSNVGKSTFFNRVSRSRSALVDDQPGITRDRISATVQVGGASFKLIDTGGFDDLGQDPLLDKVRDQVKIAISQADRIIFLVDGRQGIISGDERWPGFCGSQKSRSILWQTRSTARNMTIWQVIFISWVWKWSIPFQLPMGMA